MTKTAAHKGLFLIAMAFLLLGGPRPLMACSKSGSPASDGPKVIATDPDSLSTTDCLKHAKETADSGPLIVEMPEHAQQLKQPVKNEGGSHNMSFNFLYYLFYKFSVTEFFKTPDFSETGRY